MENCSEKRLSSFWRKPAIKSAFYLSLAARYGTAVMSRVDRFVEVDVDVDVLCRLFGNQVRVAVVQPDGDIHGSGIHVRHDHGAKIYQVRHCS